MHTVVANCASTGLWWLVLVGSLAVFTRPQLGPIIGVVTVAVLVLQLSRNRRFTVALALSLAAMIGVTGWSAVALRNFDQYNDHAAARAYFWHELVQKPRMLAIWLWRRVGRPPVRAWSDSRDVPTASGELRLELLLQLYKRECPELVAWHREEAPNYFRTGSEGPLPHLRLMTRDLPVLLQPWVRGQRDPFDLCKPRSSESPISRGKSTPNRNPACSHCWTNPRPPPHTTSTESRSHPSGL